MLNNIKNFHKNPYSKVSKPYLYSAKNVKKQNNIAFCGLNKQFERQIYPDYKALQVLYNINPDNKAIVGKPPREIVDAIKANSSSHTDVSKNIKKFMDAFSLASSELVEAERKSLEYIEDFDIDEYVKQFVIYSDNWDLNDVIAAFKSHFGINKLPETERQKYEQKAAAHIEKAAKDIGIISKDDTVELEYIGLGGFGAVYNVSFKDKNGEKIFHDKALKVYRNKDNEFSALKTLFAKLQSIISDMGYYEFYEKYSAQIEDLLVSHNPINSIFYRHIFSNLDEILGKFFDAVDSASFEDFNEAFNKNYCTAMGMHGCFAEANRAVFLDNAVYHIETSDYIEPYFFNLKDGFGLFEKADNSLPEVKTTVDLSKFGLEHDDLNKKNEHNKVCGRIIDYGGIVRMDYYDDLFDNVFLGDENNTDTKTVKNSTTSNWWV